jgi:hypothetical protein
MREANGAEANPQTMQQTKKKGKQTRRFSEGREHI